MNMKRIIFAVLCVFFVSLLPAIEIEGVFGIYRVVLHDNAGTFSLYMENAKNNKYVPILNPLDSSSGTRFYLKSGSLVYVLSKSAGVPVSQYLTETGFRVEYTVKNIAIVNFDFSFCSSETGELNEFADIIIVDAFVTNISKKTDSFALKAIFDTYLGESQAKNFSTKTIPIINEEISFLSMKDEKWIKTSDGINSMQFLLDGYNVTSPLSVTLANRDILLTDVWTPNLIPGRGYNSLFSFNNSAVCIHWDSSRISPQLQNAMHFYISAASNGYNPPDMNSLYFKEKNAEALSVDLIQVADIETEDGEGIIVEVKKPENIENIPPKVENPEIDKAVIQEKVVVTVEKTEPVEDTSIQDLNPYEYTLPLTQEQLDPAYIENLLEKIGNMETDSSEIDREEILRLNAELDAILEFLRR